MLKDKKTSEKKPKNSLKVAVVGATGLVGQEMVRVLADREFPVSTLELFASENSVGEKIDFGGEEIAVQELRPDTFSKNRFDLVLFGASAEISARYVPLAAESGAFAVDNSSHYRMHKEIPLIVPEVNPDALEMAKSHRIIANPNCSTIQLVVCLKPLHDAANLQRVVVSSYQSVSGAGSAALEELETQIRSLYSQEEIKPKVFPHQIAFNCIPHIDDFTENGFTKEEMKIIRESRKILNLPHLRITATAVRVPTLVSHGESVNIECEKALSAERAREVLSDAGVCVLDEPQQNLYPMGFQSAGYDEVFVGRIRKDESHERGLHLWIVADNLRKGAATNAVQIGELLRDRHYFAQS